MNHIIPNRYSSTRSNRRAANNSLDTAEHAEFENPTLPQLKQTLAELVGLDQALANGRSEKVRFRCDTARTYSEFR